MKKTLSLSLALCLCLVLATAALAATGALTPGFFGKFMGKELEDAMNNAPIDTTVRTWTVGDVTYTLTDALYLDGELYGTIVLSANEGSNVVLLPEDTLVTDPAGYNIANGEVAPEGAPTYLDLAKEKGAKLLQCRVVTDAYRTGEEWEVGDMGVPFEAQKDGTIIYSFEICGADEAKDWKIDVSEKYDVQVYLSNTELAENGEAVADSRKAETVEFSIVPTSENK